MTLYRCTRITPHSRFGSWTAPVAETHRRRQATTVYRYVTEAVELLAALAPTLAEAVRSASMKAYPILDGTLLPIDRIAADRPFCSGSNTRSTA